MTVSSHLTPEPERRLWIILENMRHAGETADAKIAALTVLSALELALVSPGVSNPAGIAGTALLGLALPLGVLGFSSLKKKNKWLGWLEQSGGKPGYEDVYVSVDDMVKYTHGELILKLDKYLGGGITATPYYEDIVGQMLAFANVAARKQKLFCLLSWLVGAGQLALVARLFLRG